MCHGSDGTCRNHVIERSIENEQKQQNVFENPVLSSFLLKILKQWMKYSHFLLGRIEKLNGPQLVHACHRLCVEGPKPTLRFLLRSISQEEDLGRDERSERTAEEKLGQRRSSGSASAGE